MISEKELAIIAGNTTFLKGKRLFQNDCVQLQTNFKNQVTGLVAVTIIAEQPFTMKMATRLYFEAVGFVKKTWLKKKQ